MEIQNTRDTKFEMFKWTIEDFYNDYGNEHYTEEFFLCGHKWQIIIYPYGYYSESEKDEEVDEDYEEEDFVSIYLEVVDVAKLPDGWSISANFKLSLINQLNREMTLTEEAEDKFNASKMKSGFEFMAMYDLRDSSRGFVVNNTCIIVAEISINKSKDENQVNQPITKIDVLSKESSEELMDFRGLGKIEKAFVPLIEKACSQHPSIIDCLEKRSNRYVEWALAALGGVLCFLKTKKVRDMDEDACNDLQSLWEELELVRFDLTWLQPHVDYALSVKSYVEKVKEVKRIEESVGAFEMEAKRLMAEMVKAEVDLEITRRELVKAGFEHRDLDEELGHGI